MINQIYVANGGFDSEEISRRKRILCAYFHLYCIPCKRSSWGFVLNRFRENPNVLVIMDKVEPLITKNVVAYDDIEKKAFEGLKKIEMTLKEWMENEFNKVIEENIKEWS